MLAGRNWNRWSLTVLGLTCLTLAVMVWIFSDDISSTVWVPGNSGPPSNARHVKDDITQHIAQLRANQRHNALEAHPFTPMSLSATKNISYDVGKVLDKMNKDKIKQDDPKLIQVIRDNFIFPPSTEEYNLDNPSRLEYSNGQAPFVDSRLNYMVSIF